MKIIDRKGKVFGLINVIDLGVILVLIVLGYISFNLARTAKLGYPIEDEARVLFSSVPLDVVKKLHPGDMEDGHSKLVRFEVKEKDDGVDIHAWLKLSLRVKDVPVGNRGRKVSSFFLKGAEININDPIIFTTSKYSIRGILLNIGSMDREIEMLLHNDIPREVTDAVRVRDRIIHYGHLVGEVIAKEYTPAGQVRVRLHIKRGESSLNVGESFFFRTADYKVYGFIIKSRPWRKD